jgi:hypothetical protein
MYSQGGKFQLALGYESPKLNPPRTHYRPSTLQRPLLSYRKLSRTAFKILDKSELEFRPQ